MIHSSRTQIGAAPRRSPSAIFYPVAAPLRVGLIQALGLRGHNRAYQRGSQLNRVQSSASIFVLFTIGCATHADQPRWLDASSRPLEFATPTGALITRARTLPDGSFVSTDAQGEKKASGTWWLEGERFCTDSPSYRWPRECWAYPRGLNTEVAVQMHSDRGRTVLVRLGK
jgi:hypothetical protein